MKFKYKTILKSIILCIISLVMCLEGSVFGQGEVEEKRIAITFDDGPHGCYTEQILEILKQYNIPATFFVVGTNVRRYPELIKKELAEGHEIGSHTYYHRHIAEMDQIELKNDLELNEQTLMELTGIRPRLFRPPEGVCNDNVKNAAREMGYSIVMWTVDTNDWRGIEGEKIVDCVKKNVAPNSIVLFHDFVSGKSGTPDALKVIIPYLLDSGYIFVTVSQLLDPR